MKRLLFLVIIALFLGTTQGFAQKTGASYLPPQTAETPDWFRIFYAPDFSARVNVIELDKSALAYRKAMKEILKREETEEIETGEEEEDIYSNFYKRWRRANDKYVREDGSLHMETPIAESTSENTSAKPTSPTSEWSLLGPVETFWSATNNKAPWQTNIYAVGVAPSDPNILYACPETGGIFKTTDKGLNWSCKTINYSINTSTAIQVHPTNPDVVYAGRDNQLITSTDGGSTWQIEGMPWGDVHTIRFKPSDPSVVFAATDFGLFKKVTAGTAISQGTPFNINALKTTDPTWNRNTSDGTTCSSSAGTNKYYRVFPFTVSTAGSYTFMMCTPTSDWDAHASLFQNAFDGSNPCAVPSNHLYSDDDANSGGNCNNDPMFTVTLTTGVTYYLVSTSFNDLVTGAYQWTFTGPGGATLSSTNAGWIQVPTVNTTCLDVFFKEGDDTNMFVLKQGTTNVEFWKSTDGGNNFSASISGWPAITSTAGRMTTTAADPNRLYAVLLGSTAPADIPHIVRSNDAGDTWSLMCTGVTGLTGSTASPLGMSNGQGFYDLDIIGNPNNANEVIAGTTSAYRSTDGGATFTAVGGYQGSLGIHPDIQEMIAIGGDTWITTDGGLNYSTDFFATAGNFSPRFKGIFSSDMWGFAQGWNEDIVGGGRYHNGNTAMSEAYPSGEAIRLGGGEQATGYYMVGRPRYIAFSDINPKIVPTVRDGALADFTFTKFPNEDGYGNDMSEIEFLPYCYNTIYTGNGNDFWRSTDGGVLWTSLHTFSGRVKEFEISRSNPNVIYLATYTPTQLHKSTDGGLTWTVLTLPTGASVRRGSLALSYTNENALWMVSPYNTSNNRVFKTTDGGATWTNLTTSTINGQAYTAIVHQQGTDNGVYIFGDNGKVYYKSDSEADWVPFSTGLPKVSNNEHILPFYRDSKIRSAGNHGIWQIDFYEEGAPVAQLTVDKLTTSCGRDTFFFEDYSAVNHAGATWSWSFPGATYVSSTTVRNPKVVYSALGTYDVSMTVTTPSGSSTKTLDDIIQVVGNECVPDTIPGHLLTLLTNTDYAVQRAPLNITTNNMTLSAWIKPAGTQMSGAGVIFSGSGGASGLNFKDNNQLGYHWADGASTYNWNGGPTVPADEWSHVVLVIKDGIGTNDTATIYLNGVPYSRIGTHNPVLFNTVFQIGRDRSNTSRNYVGKMDEISIYNRALSIAEVRELMNLTRNNPNAGSMPSNDPFLMSYYQFNEELSSIPYDKVGPRHLLLAGNANKNVVSTAPVGGGRFHRIKVNTGGVKDFSSASLSMTFPASGPYPNGDMVVTRLNVPSDQLCAPQILPDPAGYWVLRNYGNNATFNAITEMTFQNVMGTNVAQVTNPELVQLFKRAHNADGNTWGSSIDAADVVTNNLNIGNITFNTGLTLTTGQHQFELANNSALPLNLLRFTAHLTGDAAGLLEWESSEEKDFKGYSIEHSLNGRDFVSIGFVAGKGSGAYSFLHSPLTPGYHYYRLKMVDLDASFRYSSIQTVEYRKADGDYQVYPNPNTDGWFHLDIADVSSDRVSVAITNAAGQLIHTFELENLQNNSRNLFHLPFSSGVYTMTITPENGVPVQKRLVIER